MKSLRFAIFVAVALAQLSVPASMIWSREQTLRHGRLWKFKTEPVDPVDAIRGRYVVLRVAAEEVPPGVAERVVQNMTRGATIYVKLKEDADGFAQIDQVSTTSMTGDDMVKAKAGYWHDHSERVQFPFDRLWLTEKIAPEAERAYRENSRREKQNAHITVRVHNGDAAIEQLYIDNQPLADYLRAHSPR